MDNSQERQAQRAPPRTAVLNRLADKTPPQPSPQGRVGEGAQMTQKTQINADLFICIISENPCYPRHQCSKTFFEKLGKTLAAHAAKNQAKH